MSTGLRFRNVSASPDDPVETWPLEAVHTALARGSLTDWRRMVRTIKDDPWGPTARQVEEVLSYDRPYGVSESMSRIVARARREAEAEARREVAAEISAAIARSGLSQREFASRLGTSASRLSTYVSGAVTPSASLLVRARRISKRQNATAIH